MKYRSGLIIIALLTYLIPVSKGQSVILSDNNGKISFFSSAPLEDISSENTQVKALLNPVTGEIAVVARIEAFEFRKKLMKKHFNEQYMESDKYPEARFTGIIHDIVYSEGSDKASTHKLSGQMLIHGVKHEMNIEVTLIPKGRGFEGKSVFIVRPGDFGIEIPKLLNRNIADEIEVKVELKLQHNEIN